MAERDWWHGAVIYEIYLRSFYDSNGDGTGDLPGIISKLDYLADLGVDALWISPFFRSPMKDFGYDVSDYRQVDPLFGTLADFDRLVEEAHGRGIRIMIDQVLSHTSDEHAWFQASRQDRDNDKADWYVWADPKPDGTPPNNWLAIFGGSAWQWEPRRMQYYLHNFLVSQPDLNYHCPAVAARMLEEVEFWLKRGVDGLRLDAINFCFHDPLLRDNPPKPPERRKGRGFATDNPYAWQFHVYDNTRPENLAFLEKLRRLTDRYPAAVTLGEVSSEDSLATTAEYTGGSDRLHMAYNFELLVDEFSTAHIRGVIESFRNQSADAWPCWALGNHDIARVVSRWRGNGPASAWARLLNAFLFSLRGSVCSYQGEELGLEEAELPRDDLRDPYGIAFWPAFKGRDGCRTPMPWVGDGPACGFSSAKPWLPIPAQHRASPVSRQLADGDSVLNAYRTFLRWRRGHPALRYGDIRFVDSPPDTLCFVRDHANESLLACFNFSSSVRTVPLSGLARVEELGGHGFGKCALVPGQVAIPAHSAFFAYVKC
ncbi:MAG: alpha-glucosidase [Steroidobacteraceae bacterium]